MSDTSTTASVNLQINGQQAQETLANLKQAALRLTNEIAKAAAAGDKVTLKKLRRELTNTKRQIAEMESATMQVEAVLSRLDKTSPRQLQKTLATLQKQLEYCERGTKEWTDKVRQIQKVKEEIARVNNEMRVQENLLQRFNRKWFEWQTAAMGTVAALTGVVMAGRKAVQTYAEIEQEMANVRKYTGMSAEQVEVLNEEFKKMDTRTTREGLNLLAQEAGRLGKTSQEDVLGFVRAADKINVALDELGEGATLQISKLANIFGDEEVLGTEQAMLSIGSVINELSQNCTASAGYLVNFGQRLAGVGAQADMTIPQIMAFGAVLDSQGQKTEMSATALSKLIMNLFKKTETIAQVTGMELEEFQAALNRSTNEGLLMLLQRLHDLGGVDVLAPLFSEMGENGARASAVMSALAGNIDMVRWQQEEAQKAFEAGTSVIKEYNVQNNTVQAGLEKARKRIYEISVQLGQELMPIMRHIMSSTSALMKVLLVMVRFLKEYGVVILSAAAAIAAYNIAVNIAAIKTAVWNGLVKVATALQAAWNAVLSLNPMGLLAAGIAGATVVLTKLIGKKKEAVKVEKEEYEAIKNLVEIDKQADEEYTQQAAKIRALSTAVHDNSLELEQRRIALEELRELVPSYHAELTREGELINDNAEALDTYIAKLKENIRLKANQQKIEQLIQRQIELEETIGMEEGETPEQAVERKVKYAQEVHFDANDVGMYNMADVEAYNKSLAAQGAAMSAQVALDEWKALEEQIQKVSNKVIVANLTADETPTIPTQAESAKNKFQAEDDWREREEALNRIAYAKGERNHKDYTDRMLAIEVEYHKKKLAHTDLVGNEQVTIEASYQEALKKQRQRTLEGTIEEENQRYQELMANIKQQYMDGEKNSRQYQFALEEAEVQHLEKMYKLYAEGTRERIKAEQRYNDTSRKIQLKRAEDDKRLQEQLRSSFFSDIDTPDEDTYNEQMRNLELLHQQMLRAAGNNTKEQLEIERAFQEARYQIARKYNKRIAKEAGGAYRSAIDDAAEWLKSDGGQALTGALDTIISSMSAIFSEVSNLIQAELDIETAAIEASYDAQMSAAEGNKYKEVQIEKEKEQQIAKAKAEANRKMFAMQVIQAVAQTAQGAIAAFSSAAAIPVVGWVLAPIAAAAAIAAGALQIAAIKKQQQAANATGYAEGGFTPAGPKYKEVGVVHAGEWVASQELLANPEARAIVNTLDYAQRTNTYSTLRKEDVSAQITAPVRLATASEKQTSLAAARRTSSGEPNKVMEGLSATLIHLEERLSQPFVTVNSITGDTGIKQAQERYEQLIRNKTPKHKRS